MSVSHLNQLDEALTRRGWKITKRLRGEENVLGAATWEITRSPRDPVLCIDFAGFGGMGEDISIDESYACDVRGHSARLYFSRVNHSRERWMAELKEFITALDRIEVAAPDAKVDHRM